MSEGINTKFEEYWNSLESDPSENEDLVMHCKYAAKNAWEATEPSASVERDELLAALKTTAGNIGSIKASCQCKTYDAWLDMVEAAIAKVEQSL